MLGIPKKMISIRVVPVDSKGAEWQTTQHANRDTAPASRTLLVLIMGVVNYPWTRVPHVFACQAFEEREQFGNLLPPKAESRNPLLL